MDFHEKVNCFLTYMLTAVERSVLKDSVHCTGQKVYHNLKFSKNEQLLRKIAI